MFSQSDEGIYAFMFEAICRKRGVHTKYLFTTYNSEVLVINNSISFTHHNGVTTA